jgi:hypothetical protein
LICKNGILTSCSNLRQEKPYLQEKISAAQHIIILPIPALSTILSILYCFATLKTKKDNKIL